MKEQIKVVLIGGFSNAFSYLEVQDFLQLIVTILSLVYVIVKTIRDFKNPSDEA